MDENLGVLEARATSNAVRYGRIVAVVAGAAAVGAAAFLIYRRVRRPSLKGRLKEVSPDGLRQLADELASRMKRMKNLKRAMPSVTVTVNDKAAAEPGAFESIIRKVAPAVVGTASTALIEKVTGGGSSDEVDQRGARHATPAFD
ncbi:MAG TPA: hypothetical protein VJT78_11160 [Candidatus Dormibacteraeota bacterium]|nr:hypothetical protein [Candidatus Dormibacteraeota bacterium]